MAPAKRDNNQVPVKIAASNTDGITMLMWQADPVTHRLQLLYGTGGADHGTPQAERDANMVPGMMAVSNADGKTAVDLYIDSASNKLLVKST